MWVLVVVATEPIQRYTQHVPIGRIGAVFSVEVLQESVTVDHVGCRDLNVQIKITVFIDFEKKKNSRRIATATKGHIL
jgi:hypothetical protein